MRILDLTLHNFGVFRGHHKFDFSPTLKPDGGPRHVVLLRGRNGVGKSTLFRGMELALYGSRVLGERVSRKAYSDFISGCLHKPSRNGGPPRERGGVSLRLEYVKSGEKLVIEVKREWTRLSNGVTEKLSVECNGERPDVDPADYSIWLEEFVPHGLGSLCFFDAEQMDAFGAIGEAGAFVGGALHRLLGIDLSNRLISDLERYTFTQGGGDKLADSLRAEVVKSKSVQAEHHERLAKLQIEATKLEEEKSAVESDLTVQEKLLAAEGGTYSARRPILEERLITIRKESDELKAQVHDLVSDLLPFCLVPHLCEALGTRLTKELETQQMRTANAVWDQRVTRVKDKLKKESLWSDIKVSKKDRTKFVNRLIRALNSTSPTKQNLDGKSIHNLAEPEQVQLQKWISQILHAMPEQTRRTCITLAAFQNEERKIKKDLQRAPDQTAIAPLHEEILRLNGILEDLQSRQAALNEEMGVAKFHLDQEDKKLQALQEKLSKAQMSQKQLELAEKSKAVLRSYNERLLGQKLDEFENELVRKFNSMCRKEHLLEAVRINRKDLTIEFHRSENQLLNINELSAGERQLYTLAVLWALRSVSGRQLPLVLDTPLARLDKGHRHRLLFDYFPAVSDQVVLFVTDSEINRALMTDLEPFVSRAYRLVYDGNHDETIVQDDQRKRDRARAAKATAGRSEQKALAYVT